MSVNQSTKYVESWLQRHWTAETSRVVLVYIGSTELHIAEWSMRMPPHKGKRKKGARNAPDWATKAAYLVEEAANFGRTMGTRCLFMVRYMALDGTLQASMPHRVETPESELQALPVEDATPDGAVRATMLHLEARDRHQYMRGQAQDAQWAEIVHVLRNHIKDLTETCARQLEIIRNQADALDGVTPEESEKRRNMAELGRLAAEHGLPILMDFIGKGAAHGGNGAPTT